MVIFLFPKGRVSVLCIGFSFALVLISAYFVSKAQKTLCRYHNFINLWRQI